MHKLGLIGNHISKSLTTSLFKDLSDYFDIPLTYELFDLKEEDIELNSLIDELKSKEFSGLNITYPFKEKVLSKLKHKSEEVIKTNSCNTLLFKDEIHGFNTDYFGFLHSIHQKKLDQLNNILVIGCGGVGKSISFACGELNPKKIFLLDIDEKKSSDLECQLNQSKINAEKIDNFDVKKKLSSIDLIINSSSLGHPSNPGNPLPEIEICKEGVIFFDAIYTPLNTLFLKQALKSNYRIISGLDLFLFQGFESFMLFTNRFDLKDELFLLYEKLKSNYSNFLEKA